MLVAEPNPDSCSSMVHFLQGMLSHSVGSIISSAHPAALPAAWPLLLAIASSLRSAAMSLSSFCVFPNTTANLSFRATACSSTC
jgi:hypothetical protein